MRYCSNCSQSKPLSAFGINNQRPDGRALYCKLCINRKVQVTRERKREILAAYRKKNVIANSPLEKVRRAIAKGASTRDEIHKQTRLDWDHITTCLATLRFDLNAIGLVFVEDEPHFFPLAA